MTSLFSVILVIVMAFSSIGGVTGNLEEPVSFDAKVDVNVEALLAATGEQGEVPEESMKAAKAVEDILGAITLKGFADKESAELDLYAGEDVMLSLGVKNSDTGATFASSMLGKNAVFVSNELIEKVQQQMTSSMAAGSSTDMQAMTEQLQNLDKEQLEKDFKEAGEKMENILAEKLGETETGEFTVDGITFTGKTPVNMTYTEAAEAALNIVKELAAKESVQPIIKAFSQGTDIAAEIDKEIEKLKTQPEEEKPEMQIVFYTNAEQYQYAVIETTQKTAATEETPAKEEKAYFGFGTIDGQGRGHIVITTEKQTMDMTIVTVKAEDGSVEVKLNMTGDDVAADAVCTRDAAGNIDMVENVTTKDTKVKVTVKTEGADTDRTQFALAVFMGDAEKALVSVTGSAGKGGEKVSAYDGDGITVIPFEKLMDGTDTSASTTLQMSMLNGVMQMINTLTKNLPEESASWLSSQLGSMMNPGAAVTEEAPQAEPAVNE